MQKQSKRTGQYWLSYSRNGHFTAAKMGHQSKLHRFSRSNMRSIWIKNAFPMQKQSKRTKQYWLSYSRNGYFTAKTDYRSKLLNTLLC